MHETSMVICIKRVRQVRSDASPIHRQPFLFAVSDDCVDSVRIATYVTIWPIRSLQLKYLTLQTIVAGGIVNVIEAQNTLSL